jgi:hypothetical protein
MQTVRENFPVLSCPVLSCHQIKLSCLTHPEARGSIVRRTARTAKSEKRRFYTSELSVRYCSCQSLFKIGALVHGQYLQFL